MPVRFAGASRRVRFSGASSRVGLPSGAATVLSRSAAYWKAGEQVNERVLLDLSGGRNHAYAGSNKVAFIGGRGAKGVSLQLPGTASNYASTPDHADLDITGNIDIAVRVALDDWTPAAVSNLISKYAAAGTRSWAFQVDTTGKLVFYISADGTALVGPHLSSVVLHTTAGIADGDNIWVRVTRNAATGDVAYYYAPDAATTPTTWTQLGTTIAGTVANIFSGAADINVGGHTSGALSIPAGRFYRAIVKNGIDGTTVFDADFTTQAEGTTSFVEATGKTVTVNQAAATTNDPKYLAYNGTKYAYLPGVAGNYLSTPDSAALSIPGDLTIDVDVRLDDYTPAAQWALVSNLTTGATGDGYELSILSTGVLRFTYNPGTGDQTRDSTVALGLTDGSRKWLRVSFDADNGAVGNDTRFYTSDDGVTWTQLGATVTVAGIATIGNASPALGVGARGAGTTNLAAGKFYRARIANSDARATTPASWVFDANLNGANVVEPYATFTESSSNAATVTFTRSASGRKTTLVDRTMWLLGTDDYFEVGDPASGVLDFGAADSFSAAAAMRMYGLPPGSNLTVLAKDSAQAAATPGYILLVGSDGSSYLQIGDGTVAPADGQVNPPSGSAIVFAGVRNVAADDLRSYVDGTSSAASADTTTASLANAEELRFGRLSGGGTVYAAMEFYGAGVWREALSAADVALLDSEFGTAA